MKRALHIILFAWIGATVVAAESELQRFDRCTLEPDPINDGDSFMVRCSNTVFHARLYFVDCPETSMSSESMARRVRAQMRWFGLSGGPEVIDCGHKAAEQTLNALSEPFTLHTAFAATPGHDPGGRKYVFVTTADGRDLATWLVKNGWARAYGVGRQSPDGTPRDEKDQQLADCEFAAALKRAGVWARSDAERLADLRAEERAEYMALQAFKYGLDSTNRYPLDINAAGMRQLESIRGIGPVTAERIVQARPYKNLDDLRRVRGIGPKTWETITPFLIVTNTPQ